MAVRGVAAAVAGVKAAEPVAAVGVEKFAGVGRATEPGA